MVHPLRLLYIYKVIFSHTAILRPSSLARTRDLNILYSSMGIMITVLLFDLYVVLCACRGHKVPGPSQG